MAADLGVVPRGSADAGKGVVEAQQLLHSLRDKLRALGEQRRNFRMLAEPHHRGAEHAGRRLEAAQDEQVNGPDHLLRGDRPTLDLGVHDRVHHIAARAVRVPLTDESADPPGELEERIARLAEMGKRCEGRPLVNLGQFLHRGVQGKLEECQARKGAGEFGHEVTLAALDEAIDKLVHQRAGGFFPRADLGGREVHVDQALELPLQRRVDGYREDLRGDLRGRHRDAEFRTERPPVLGESQHVLVLGQHPETGLVGIAVRDRAKRPGAG